MTLGRMGGSKHPGLVRASVVGSLLALLLTGCVSTGKIKSRPMVRPAAVEPAASQPVVVPVGETSLKGIVNNQILRGNYAEGERSLRAYLVQHPGDHPAEALLRQLTVDPRKMLGRQSSVYVVQPGDSYSTLAARYLGNANLFLVLARYNGSTNPSILRAGENLRMPSSAMADGQADGPVDGPVAAQSTAPAEPIDSLPPTAPASEMTVESSSVKATRLQRESVALMKRGKSTQALSRLDQALTLDPQLMPSGSAEVSLRKQLVASYHQRAIVLYRDQKLDQAITLWDRALAINPEFEPALIYRARAMELKRRLKQL